MDYWGGRGLGLRSCRIVDGSGLSRADYISPEELTRVQLLARKAKSGLIYRNSLGGVFGGKVRWKGGAMSAIRTYTGFVERKDGREYCFSLMFNNFADGGKIVEWRDELMGVLVE